MSSLVVTFAAGTVAAVAAGTPPRSAGEGRAAGAAEGGPGSRFGGFITAPR